MTERLFDFNSYLTTFTATVLECFEQNGKILVVLNKTAFFPEGGGQYGDKGFLNQTPVLDTFEKNGTLYHQVKSPFAVGETVTGKINWDFRFNNMQNHSGEHIVSGIVNSVYGYKNVGFHIGTDFVTIDYNGILTKPQLLEIEQKANNIVFKNLPINTFYPTAKQLKNLPYRSKKEIDGDLRIVEIPNVDICACCAPHVKTTAEVGVIKLLDFKHYKSGVRINMLCGQRAIEDYRKRYEQTFSISNKLSCKQTECSEAVDLLLNEITHLKQNLAETENQLVLKTVISLPESNKNIVYFCNFSTDALRELATKGKEKCNGMFVALNGNDTDGYKYVICADNLENFNKNIKELNLKLNGKGGGKPPLAQGMFFCTAEKIKLELE